MFFKHSFLAFALAALVAAASVSVFPQDSESNDQQSASPAVQPGQGSMRHHLDPAKRAEMLTKQLKLTSDQRSKVLETLTSEQSQMENLRSDSSASQEERRSKMIEIRKMSNDQIRALLDSSQQKKWDEMQSRREQWKGHHQDSQAPGAPPESSEQK
jgi:protein CpxP